MPHLKNLVPLMTLVLLVGCSEPDDRLAELAAQSTHEQAQQNERMAQLQQEVAAGAKQLVESEAESRREFVALHTQLQAASSEIAEDRDQLELERKELARQRVRDPIVAAAILEAGAVLACLLPLVLCVYLLRPVSTGEACDELVVELLMSDAELPRLPSPAAQRLLEQPEPKP